MLNIKSMIKLFFIILFLNIIFVQPQITKAASVAWGETSISQSVNSVGTGIEFINPKSIQLAPNKFATTYIFKNSSGAVLKTIKQSDINTSSQTTLPAKGTIRMTYMGNYDGRNVDVILTNELSTAFDVSISSDGNVRSTNVNYMLSQGAFNANKIASIKLVYNGSDTPISNAPIALTQKQDQTGVFGAISGSHFYAYDIPYTDKFYANPSDVLYNLRIMDVNSKYTIELLGQHVFEYLISGRTNSLGQYNFYKVAYGQTTTQYTFISPMKSTIVPIVYPLSEHTVNPKTVNNRSSIQIDVSQFLPEQGIDNFYPVDGTFNLNITESNVSHLIVKDSDFSLYVDGEEIAPNQYTLTVTQINGDSNNLSINLKLSTSFLKKYRGKTLNVKQVSAINKDETVIKNSLQYEEYLPVSRGTKLTYSLPTIVQSTPTTVYTEEKTTVVKIEPMIEHTVSNNLTYVKGTELSSIPVEDIITSATNIDYSWDTISMSYIDPTKILTNEGTDTVSILLKSDTFKVSKVVIVDVNVIESFQMTYEGNGGKIDEKNNQIVSFDSTGTVLPTADTRKNYKFLGWSIDPMSEKAQYSAGYVYGLKPEEQRNTILYAIWELSNELTTSWDQTISQKTKKITADRSELDIKVPYYYKSTGSQISYLVNVKNSGETIFSKKITSNTADLQDEDMLILPANLIKNYGNNLLKIEFYELNSNSEVINSMLPNDVLDLNVDITGSLKIVSVPSTLEWTTMKSSETKGIKARDNNNNMIVEVLDSRNLEEKQKNWYVQALATYEDASFNDFELVWRESANNNTENMKDNPIQVMTQNTAQKSKYSYFGVWDNQSGILLNSNNYLKVGKYYNKIIVNWSLYDVMLPK